MSARHSASNSTHVGLLVGIHRTGMGAGRALSLPRLLGAGDCHYHGSSEGGRRGTGRTRAAHRAIRTRMIDTQTMGHAELEAARIALMRQVQDFFAAAFLALFGARCSRVLQKMVAAPTLNVRLDFGCGRLPCRDAQKLIALGTLGHGVELGAIHKALMFSSVVMVFAK